MLLLPLVTVLLGLAPNSAISTPNPPVFDVNRLIQEVGAFRRRFLSSGGQADGTTGSDARGLISDLKTALNTEEEAGERVLTGLLDLAAAAHERRASRGLEMPYDRSERTLLTLTERALRPQLKDFDLLRFVTREVLLVSSRNSVSRRAAAARLFRHHEHDSAVLALLQCTRSEDELLRQTSLGSLVGWEHSAVNDLMARRLTRSQRTANGKGAAFAERHFKRARVKPDSKAEDRLIQFVKRALVSDSWREASLAIAICQGLEPKEAAPILISGLQVWNRRGEDTGGTLRVRHEIAGALQVRSGRNLGLRADRWETWWQAVQLGEIQLSEAGAPIPGHAFTSTGFFGLDPKSDRVTFVIDRSGSMDSPFSSRSTDEDHTGRTRFEEATAQLAGFLGGLGENGRFNVVIFGDRASSWRTKLQSTTRTNLSAARKWLSKKSPDGGTFLRDGIHKAVRVNRRGELDVDNLETDTIVVLCDGATTEGSGWVKPFLKRNNQEARITFHCIQIGPGGDGTLELLASETGGDFRRVAH